MKKKKKAKKNYWMVEERMRSEESDAFSREQKNSTSLSLFTDYVFFPDFFIRLELPKSTPKK